MTILSGLEFFDLHDPVAAEPVAVVAMACRLPGGITDPEGLWELLLGVGDAIGPLPADRGWDPDALDGPDRAAVPRRGGFLDGVADFDAGFFGLSPREAVATDPQQRLLLETAWEAVERAGIDPLSLHGTRTGVYVGVSGEDYALVTARAAGDAAAGAVTGTAPGVASGRLAHVLGLRGPALTLDTASSSSLTALHCAVRALRAGECTLALAGGANVLSTPRSLVGYARQGGLAPDGRCKPFSADADGTAWAEGVGVLVLERLSDARLNGHPVLALIRGTAVNADGATDRLTAPSGSAQRELIALALDDAGLGTGDVDAVEAHGTGTRVGDPVEAEALLATYGREREHPLLIGSVKANLGHAQAAAGIAGLIKTVLALRHGILPATPHLSEPTPAVDWSAGSARLLSESTDWPATGRPRRAAVSSFGIGGSNAHVVLEQAPPAPVPAEEPGGSPHIVPWVVSARSANALDAAVARLRRLDPADDRARVDIAHSLATGRATALPHRTVLLASADGTPTAARCVAEPGPSAVLFAGRSGPHAAQTRALAERFPVFARAFAAVREAFDGLLPEPLPDVVGGATHEPGTPGTHGTPAPSGTAGTAPSGTAGTAPSGTAGTPSASRTAEPLLFAYEIALYRLLESLGRTPTHLAGHGLGEIAAAHAAGALSLIDACRVVAARVRLAERLASAATVAVRVTEAEVAPLLTPDVAVAAVDGPDRLVLSGAAREVARIADALAAEGRATTALPAPHGLHSPLVADALDEFRRDLTGLEPRTPRIPVVSTLTGTRVTGTDLASPAHWSGQVSGTVRFADAVTALRDAGVHTFLEVGTDATLTASTVELLAWSGVVTVAAQRAGTDPETALLIALARLHVTGSDVHWPALFTGTGARRTELPTYPFQRERHWPTPSDPAALPVPALGPVPEATPAGRRLARSASASRAWEVPPLAAPGESPSTSGPSTGSSARHAESTLPHARTRARAGAPPSPPPGPPSGRTTPLPAQALGRTDDLPAADPDALRALTGPRRVRALLTLVRAEAAAALGHADPGRVEPRLALRSLGLDSYAETELRVRLGKATGLDLPATLFYDQPTPAALAARLAEHLDEQPHTLPDWPAGFEQALRDLPGDHPARRRAVHRLEDLLADLGRRAPQPAPGGRVDGGHGSNGGAGHGGRATADAADIAAAPVDRLLDLIDQEFPIDKEFPVR
ncbi:acyltransferase domain-containing protein [Streptomyces sp. KM273126]|uniref:type I polyketide synthase n=1 Tax=Streptomyces sp. KM273126 TaxID=2545247 RepID=UPI00103A7710|nr:type I polyketide synthase [Streptomyces sp. KM273126]MBA2811302.1 acyltransferase domain-containing protein [Streptomyces sp. KM273126]